MKKRFLCILLMMSLGIFVAGCGNVDTPVNEPANNPTNEPVTETVTEPEKTPADEGNSEDNITSDTIAQKLLLQFAEEITTDMDIEEMAQKLCQNECVIDASLCTMPVSEGYLNGFEEEITGFSKGVMFSPMIGSIPFVGYIFESEDAEGFAKVLDEKAVLNWNVCTEADEKVIKVNGNYVFFVMAPYSFE